MNVHHNLAASLWIPKKKESKEGTVETGKQHKGEHHWDTGHPKGSYGMRLIGDWHYTHMSPQKYSRCVPFIVRNVSRAEEGEGETHVLWDPSSLSMSV